MAKISPKKASPWLGSAIAAVLLLLPGGVLALSGPDSALCQAQPTRADCRPADNKPQPTNTRAESDKRAAPDGQKQRRDGSSDQAADSRRQRCETALQHLVNKSTKHGASAERHLERINQFYDRAKEYQRSHNLKPSGYDQLLVRADAAKAAAEKEVAALRNLKPNISCESSQKEKAESYKRQLASTRGSLKAYRQAVKDVLVALRATNKDANQKKEN